MAYRVILAPRAQKDLAAIRDTRESQRLRGAILRLEEDPRPRGALKLSGSELWRIRVGHFRVMYEIEDERVIVRIVRVRHRREAYRTDCAAGQRFTVGSKYARQRERSKEAR